jgi:hypothetical protein
MKNREKCEIILDCLRSNKLKLYNVSYGNGYFLFEMGEDSVCWFQIKGARNWRFAIWLNTNEETMNNKFADLFAQYIPDIDKFKPSRSYHRVEIEKWIFTNNKYEDGIWIDSDIIKMIKSIIKHPFISYYRFCSDNNWDDFSKLYPLFYFIRNRSIKMWWEFKRNFMELYDYCFMWLKLFFIKIVDERIVDFEIEDQNDENWRSSPRYDLKILVNNGISDDEICSWEEFWFKKYRKNISRRIRYYIDDFEENEIVDDENNEENGDKNE